MAGIDQPKFLEPDGTNVKLGDFLVGRDEHGKTHLGKITNINWQTGFRAQIGNSINEIKHNEAIILTQDGRYYVGKQAREYLQ